MLKLKIPSLKKSQSTLVEYKDGISFCLRPLTMSVSQQIESKNKKMEWVKDPVTHQMVKVANTENEKILNDTLDYVIESVSGVEVTDEETGNVLPNDDIRVKKAVVFMYQENDGGETLWDFILRTSRELAVCHEEEKEAELKN